MEHVYPPGSAAVPPNLTAATAAYKRHAWLAMLGLAAFIASYFTLSAWFAWTSWRLLAGMFGAGGAFGTGADFNAPGSRLPALAMTRVKLLMIERTDLLDLVARYPDLATHLRPGIGVPDPSDAGPMA